MLFWQQTPPRNRRVWWSSLSALRRGGTASSATVKVFHHFPTWLPGKSDKSELGDGDSISEEVSQNTVHTDAHSCLDSWLVTRVIIIQFEMLKVNRNESDFLSYKMWVNRNNTFTVTELQFSTELNYKSCSAFGVKGTLRLHHSPYKPFMSQKRAEWLDPYLSRKSNVSVPRFSIYNCHKFSNLN